MVGDCREEIDRARVLFIARACSSLAAIGLVEIAPGSLGLARFWLVACRSRPRLHGHASS